MLKIGIFGGSFDPVHNGHLMLACHAKEELELERVVFVPCNNSAWLGKKIEAPNIARIQMLDIALKNIDYFEYSLVEIKKPGISYTIDTVEYFIEGYKKIIKDDYFKLFLLFGPDVKDKFTEFKDYKRIMTSTEVCFAGSDFMKEKVDIHKIASCKTNLC